jgi:YggT family protein
VNIFHFVAWLLQAYVYLIMLPMALLSWFRVQPGTTLARVQLFLYRATEPVLRPVRRIIRPMGGIDISFLVVILVVQLVLVPVLER